MENIDAKTVKKWKDEGKLLLIDVRETAEREVEFIPGSEHHAMSSFDSEKVKNSNGLHVVFHCAAGVRSEKMGKLWMAKSGETAYNFPGGVKEWLDEGFSMDIDEMAARELQLKAYRFFGALLILCSLLIPLVSSLFWMPIALIGGFLFMNGWKGDALIVLLLKNKWLEKV